MTREFDPDDEEEPQREPEPPGSVDLTSWGAVIGTGLVGLVGGWLVRPVSIRISGVAPTVGWLPVGVLFFVAAALGFVAWTTHRAFHRQQERIEPHRAVNRLVLAKACCLVGALLGGGYFGFALSYLGLVDTAMARTRVVQAVLAGIAGIGIVVAARLLERACRVPHRDDGHLP